MPSVTVYRWAPSRYAAEHRREEPSRFLPRFLSSAGGPKGADISTAAQRYGRAAERAAADYLSARGYRVLARNQRVGRGELDIIVRRGSILAFVEVKARRGERCGTPEEAVSAAKRAQVARLAELWLASRPWALAGVTEVRLDIVAVSVRGSSAQIRHLPGAFSGGW